MDIDRMNLETFTLEVFMKVKSLDRTAQIQHASYFLTDIHNHFQNILTIQNDSLSSTPRQQQNGRKGDTAVLSENFSAVSTPESACTFVTSTPESSSKLQSSIRNDFSHSVLSPLNKAPFNQHFCNEENSGFYNYKQQKLNYKQNKRGRRSFNSFHPKPENHGSTQKQMFDQRFEDRMEANHGVRCGKTSLNFDLSSADDFPAVSDNSDKPKRRLLTTVVLPHDAKKLASTTSLPGTETSNTVQAFRKPTLVPAPASAMPRSIWAKPPQEVVEHSVASRKCKENISRTSSSASLHSNQGEKDQILSTRPHNPSFSEVTNIEGLNLVADFYSYIINEGFTASVVYELFTIVQLLTINKSNLKCKEKGGRYFSSLDNIVYFACRVLQTISSWLEILGHQTLRDLSENSRLKEFAPQLPLILTGWTGSSQPEDLLKHEVILAGGITFDEETDNRDNFPSDSAFHAFKKQRDLFYELLREWEEQHLTIGWSMKSKMIDRINSIMNGHQPTIHLHFVRLFVSQLVQSCCHASQLIEDTSNINEQLKSADPNKLKRLQGRFVASPISIVQSVNPTFPLTQEFFKEFIVLSCNHTFCSNLTYALYAKIQEISESTSNLMLDSSTNNNTASSYFQSELMGSIITLRILGKFLGLISFLPFSGNESLTKKDEANFISLRNKFPESVDILNNLKHHFDNGSLIVGLSWALDYLSLMDSTAKRLDRFIDVLSYLAMIYNVCFLVYTSCKPKLVMLLSCMMGWFFELDVSFKEMLLRKHESLTNSQLHSLISSFDQSVNIKSEVIYRCYPTHIGEIYNLLHSFINGHQIPEQQNQVLARKINTKFAPQKVYKNESTTTTGDPSNIQKKLEVNFFRMHAKSLKRTVEFVSERIFSCWVLKYQGRKLSQQLKAARHFAREIVTPGFKKEELIDAMNRKSDQLSEELLQGGEDFIEDHCRKSGSTLACLLPESTASQVLSVSTAICSRNITLKARCWKTENISSVMFLKEIISEMNKQFQSRSMGFKAFLTEPNTSYSFNEYSIEILKISSPPTQSTSFQETEPTRSKAATLDFKNVKNLNATIDRSISVAACDEDDDGAEENKQNHSMHSVVDGRRVEKIGDVKTEKDDNGDVKRVLLDDDDDRDALLIHPSELFLSVQETLVQILRKKFAPSTSCDAAYELNDLMLRFSSVFADRHKILLPNVRKHLQLLSVNLALSVLKADEDAWTENVEKRFISLWKQEKVEPDIFSELISQSKADKRGKLSGKHQMLVNKLLKERLISSD